jgi:hypothetical protein
MQGIVIIPCWNRPGFLHVCLEHIKNAKGFDNYEYYFCVDRGNYSLYQNVICSFSAKNSECVIRPPHNYKGNVYNFLNAFRDIQKKGKAYDIIHLIEDDVFIAPDYFDYHLKAWEAVKDEKDVFAVSACRNDNLKDAAFEIRMNPDSAIYLHQSYQSLGVSFTMQSINKIARHAIPAYWNFPVQYLQNTFPSSKLPKGQAEQAGLIHRIVIQDNLQCAFPVVPRAYHAGFAGKNRTAKKHESYYTAEEIRKMTQQQMNQEAVSHPDIKQCDMIYRNTDKLVLI